jgi:DNA-nicking Smr family endonuclease
LRKLSGFEPSSERTAAGFAETMRREGAVPLPAARGRVAPPTAGTNARGGGPRTATPTFRVTEDDGWIEGVREDLPARDSSRLHGAPGATLDLHGHRVESARRALSAFINRERKLGRERVLVIVGKGLRAPGGTGVLRSSIGEWLSEPPLGAHVLAFESAPREHGGSGAVMVLLAPRKTRRSP